MVFRFLLIAMFLAVGSLPEAIASDVSGVRQIEVTHSHDEASHDHDHEHSDGDHHHHGDEPISTTDSQVTSIPHSPDEAHTHTHQIIIVGIQALFPTSNTLVFNDFLIAKFPFPRDLSIPLSQSLGSIFRPPKSA